MTYFHKKRIIEQDMEEEGEICVRGAKKMLMVFLILLLFAAVGAGMLWHFDHYVMVDMTFYPKNAGELDLRDREISISHYEKLRRRLPDCRIRWHVPIGELRMPNDTEEIIVSSLQASDIRVLDYLEQLQTVRAEACTDYEILMALQKHRPELEVIYNVQIGEEAYGYQARRIDVKNFTEEEISRLDYLPNLETVVCSGGDTQSMARLQEYCQKQGLEFAVSMNGKILPADTKSLEVTNISREELNLLTFLPELKQVHLEQPEASGEQLQALCIARPEMEITWEKTVLGQTCSSEDEEIDLSKAKLRDLEEVREAMAYFPKAQKVFLGECGLDNEELAAFREEMREDYKVVWTVQCGEKMKARTDDTTFMPTREHVYYFNDEEAYNLRYCEDMVCIDIGHMSISELDFLEFMPDLEYLVLAHTQVQYIEPIQHCKKLKFLELDWAPVKDYSPLVELTNLEDLNLGNTYADFEPIGKMTWLKNLWMIGCSRGPAYRMTQALPETKVMVSGSATVANGWRNLENYYEMRDLLGMEYMSW